MVNRAGFQYDTGVYIMQNTIVVGERGNMTAVGKIKIEGAEKKC